MHAIRRLPSGREAALVPDPLRPGAVVLTIDGSEQSHIDPASPGDLALEYVRRIGTVLDAFRAPGEPIRVLHLGGGALTLARYVAATRPGSEQQVVEREVGLTGFVLEHAPLPCGSRLQLHEGDARSELPPGPFDAIVLDVYVGTSIPAGVADADYSERMRRALGPAGVLVVNVADEAGLAIARSWRRRLAAVFDDTALVGAADVIAGRSAGNGVLLAASGRGELTAIVDALLRHGPHPAAADPEGDVVVVQVPVEVDP